MAFIRLVHTAPSHGQEDFLTGMKYKLLILSPVDDNGKFTKEIGQFASLDVLGDGNVAIVKILDEHSCLIMEEVYKHKYTNIRILMFVRFFHDKT